MAAIFMINSVTSTEQAAIIPSRVITSRTRTLRVLICFNRKIRGCEDRLAGIGIQSPQGKRSIRHVVGVVRPGPIITES